MSAILSFDTLFKMRHKNSDPNKITPQRKWWLNNKEKARANHRKWLIKFYASMTPEQMAEYQTWMRTYKRLYARMFRARNPGRDYQNRLKRVAKMSPEEKQKFMAGRAEGCKRYRERQKQVAAVA